MARANTSASEARMNKKLKWIGGSMLVAGLIAAGVIYTHFDEAVPYVAMGINYFRYMNAPKGTISIESAPNFAAIAAPAKPIAVTGPTPIGRAITRR